MSRLNRKKEALASLADLDSPIFDGVLWSGGCYTILVNQALALSGKSKKTCFFKQAFLLQVLPPQVP
jgi:hypothetical protein